MQTYKFRAECYMDVFSFLQLTGHGMKRFLFTEDNDTPDCELEFDTDVNRKYIVKAIKMIPDHHVMLETFAEKELYTGERS